MTSEMNLSPREVFEMAEQIETDAASFYRRAARATSDPDRRDMLTGLATMEAGHGGVFAGMRSLLPDLAAAKGHGPASAPAGNGGGNWPGLTSILASGVQNHLAERFTGHETSDEIIRKAIAFEKDTVVFFANIKAMMTGDPQIGRKIDEVLAEELGHILSLSSQLVARK